MALPQEERLAGSLTPQEFTCISSLPARQRRVPESAVTVPAPTLQIVLVPVNLPHALWSGGGRRNRNLRVHKG